MQVLIREAMTSPAVAVRDTDHVRTAAKVLLDNRIASAPVVNDAGDVVGIVSEADVLRGRTQADPRAHMRPKDSMDATPEVLVADVMTTPALTVRGDEDVDEAARLLLDYGIKMLPVVESGQVVGIVARRDLLRSFARQDGDIRRDVIDLLAEMGQEGVRVVVQDGVVTLMGAQGKQRIASVLARTVPGVVRVVRTSACGPYAELG